MAVLTVGPGKSYGTISSALAAARTGSQFDFDTIEIYNDTYNETVTSGTAWIRFQNAEGVTTMSLWIRVIQRVVPSRK